MERLARLAVASLLAAALASCSSESTGPVRPRVEGTYVATQFIVATADTSFDVLTEGVSLTITLNRGGTTTGALHVAEVLLDLAGEWDTAGGLLHFQTATPTFLTRAPLAIIGNQLRGDFSLEGGTIHLTLSK
jgi:hypothetical protein